MVRRSKLILIFLVMSVIMTAMGLSVPSGADLFVNGLTASADDLALGETFTLYINIPPESQLLERHDADSLNFKIYYDSDALEILSYPDSLDFLNAPTGNLRIKKSNCGSDAGGSFFSFAASSSYCDIPTKNGMRLSATFRVRTDTKKGYVNFSLAEHVLAYTTEENYEVNVVDLWRNVTAPDLQLKIPENIIPDTATKGGLQLSSDTAYTTSVFTADITIPSITKIIDTAQLTLTYRSEYFELLSVSEGSSGLSVSTDKNSGIIYFYAENAAVDLQNGAVLTATFKVKQNTPANKNYLFRLSRSELIYRGNSLWNPENISDELTVINSEDYFPGNGGGIYLSSDYTSPNTDFSVFVKIPAADASADNLKIRVEYSGNSFDLTDWVLPATQISVSYGNGYIEFTNNYNSDINLRNGLLFKANMRTGNINPGKFSFRLTEYKATSSKIDYSLWTPSSFISYINVITDYIVTTRDPYVTMDSRQFTTTSSPLPYATVSDGDTTRPVTGSTGSSQSNYYDDNDGVFDPDDSDNDGVFDPDDSDNDGVFDPDDSDNDGVFDPDDSDTTYPSDFSNGESRIFLDSNISGVNGLNVSAYTRTEFFSGDIIIYLRNTNEAESYANAAMNTLGLTSGSSYAFDISLYNNSTGRYIHDIGNGFVDFTIPIPSAFSGKTGSIDVYHIADGYPEYIESSIITENGIQKISFRASSFSPYMLVMNAAAGSYDTTTVYVGGNSENTNSNNSSDSNNSSGDTKGAPDAPTTGRPANPHTGYIIAAAVPTVTAVCVILARKEKRKRCSKR